MTIKDIYMNQLKSLKTFFTILFGASLCSGCITDKRELLVDNFVNPPEETKPGLYWYWINEHVSKEGITKDLEAMKSVGINEAFIGNIFDGGEAGNIKTMSEEWIDCMCHAVKEGRRIGVNISLFNAPGWSQSGGPWVKPDEAMRFLTYQDTIVNSENGIRFNLNKISSDFQDVSILAYKVNNNKNYNLIDFKSDTKILNQQALFDGDKQSKAKFENGHRSKICLDLKYDNEFTARSLVIQPTGIAFNTTCELLVKTDNNQFVPVSKVFFDRSNTSLQLGPKPDGKLVMSIDEVKGKEFRILMDDLPQNFELSQISLSSEVKIEKVTEKALSKLPNTSTPSWSAYRWDSQKTPSDYKFISKDEVVDISNKVKDGILDWNAPKGEWKIVRVGMLPTYTTNTPAAPAARGLEIDKLNKEVCRKHFDSFVGEIRKRLSSDDLKALKRVIADSYEVGPQNWSDTFRDDFIEQMGYDPIPYLPVLTGDVIGSVNESDRFLWDVRRVVADLIAQNYVGGLVEVAQENDMTLWLENYGHWGYPSEFLKYSKFSHNVGGEFWAGSDPTPECKLASSACNIYGKNDVFAESYTAWGQSYRWHPGSLRKKGDWSYTEGVNHVIMHVYIHQPYEEKQPGINAWFGIEFNRHNTWFEQSKAWIDYQRRCCYILKQGQPVRDSCFFIGDDAPQMNYWVDPSLPKGYSYDLINSDVICNYLKVKDGKLVLPSGLSYSALVLPPLKTMRPELLEAISNLVKQGAIVVGNMPENSPSLKDYPNCDSSIKLLSTELWGIADESIRQVGKGKVYSKMPIADVIKDLGIKKDLSISSFEGINWTHRKFENIEIYFLSNQSESEFNNIVDFRVDGLRPELWNAASGEITELSSFWCENNITSVPLKLRAGESTFVVFSKKGDGEKVLDIEKNYPQNKRIKSINGVWNIKFENKYLNQDFDVTANSLSDWTESEDNRIKYFSGDAMYSTTFNYKGKSDNVYIHFDNINVIGTLYVNNHEVSTLWTPPYEANISKYIKDGENKLQVKISNLWVNQLIYQNMRPKHQRDIWLLVDPLNLDDKLSPSGISGECYLFKK